MILYKYLTFESALRVLGGNSIGFSEPRDFNDPFETAARIRKFEEGLRLGWGRETRIAKPLFSHQNHVLNPWSHNVAVLSLTRQPRNKLMLAHYCDNHRGVVIGIDISKVPDFTSNEYCYIPAQFGSVVYTETMPNLDQIAASGDVDKNWETCSYEMRQRALLHKDMAWSMEEEVRIVISLRDYETKFKVVTVDDRPLYLYPLPDSAIAEIHLGSRSPILPATDGEHTKWLELKKLIEKHESCKPYQLVLNDTTWGIDATELNLSTYDAYWELHHERLRCD